MKVYRPYVIRPQDAYDDNKAARIQQLKQIIASHPAGTTPSFQSELRYLEMDAQSKRQQAYICQPGKQFPEVQEWQNEIPVGAMSGVQGGLVRTPKIISIMFVQGEAEVEERLGRYLIEHEGCFAEPQEPTYL